MYRLFMQSWSIVYRSLYLGRWKAMVHLCSLCRQLYTLRGCRETVWPADSSIHSYKSCLCNTAAHKERSTQPSKHLLQEPAATSLSCGLRRSTTTNKKHITPLSYCQTAKVGDFGKTSKLSKINLYQIKSYKYWKSYSDLKPLPCVQEHSSVAQQGLRNASDQTQFRFGSCQKHLDQK